MKITPDHLAVLTASVQPMDTPARRAQYLSGDFVCSSKVKDLDKRYRWDLLYMSDLKIGDGKGMGGLPLYAYMDDTHIDTALRSFIPPLKSAPVAKHFVLNEHTLGFVYDEQPHDFWIHAGKPQLGGHDWKNGSAPIGALDVLRPATLADFEFYRVSPKGHIV